MQTDEYVWVVFLVLFFFETCAFLIFSFFRRVCGFDSVCYRIANSKPCLASL
jgi:hypothetical protein